MRFSLEWLRDFVQVDLPPAELAARLTTSGFEVGSWEEYVPASSDTAGGAHPVSGGKADKVFEIDITANRPDAMNHLGLAREIAAILDRPLKLPEFVLVEDASPASASARVAVEAWDLCPRYVGRVVVGLRVAESPSWLKQRLAAIGLAPKNNVVDASNYVLFELGQPLHAFDLERLSGRGVVVRRSRSGEKIVTVADRQERTLPEGTLVIGQAGGGGRGAPAAIAGVMGGYETAITESTTEVLIESAWFEPRSVRRAARALGLHSDASHRFERGADPGMTRFAADRLAVMIAELAGGRVLCGVLDAKAPDERISSIKKLADRPPSEAASEAPSSRRTQPEGALTSPLEPEGGGGEDLKTTRRLETLWREGTIGLRTERLSSLLGVETDPARVRETLARLSIEAAPPSPSPAVPATSSGGPSGASGAGGTSPTPSTALSFRIPSWRGDISREEDLIEEYARLTGYDGIAETLPCIESPPPPRSGPQGSEDHARDLLASFGYREAITYAMISRADDALFGALDPDPERGSLPLVIGNPLSDRWEVMRRSLLPGLTRAVAFNLARGRLDVRLFEIGAILDQDRDGKPRELRAAAIGASGLATDPAWPSAARPYDVLDLKGAVESLLADLLGLAAAEQGRVSFDPLEDSCSVGESPGGSGPGVPQESTRDPESRPRVWPFHSRQSFSVRLDGRVVGRGGRLHAEIERAIESDRPLLAAEISLEPFLNVSPTVRFRPLPRLNPVERDLSLIVRRGIPHAQVQEEVRRAVLDIMKDALPEPHRGAIHAPDSEQALPEGTQELSSFIGSGTDAPEVFLIDRFEGESLPPGTVSYTFRFRFSPRERTLLAEGLNAAIVEIGRRLETTLGAQIRSR